MKLNFWIDHWASVSPDKTAISFIDRQTTYAVLADEIARLAIVLQQTFGVKQGDRIAWLGYNHPGLIETLFACARIGAILVPLNWRLAVSELAQVLQDSGADLLIAGEDQQSLAAQVTEKLAHCQPIHANQTHPAYDWPALQPLLSRVDSAPVETEDRSDEPVLILYTSGTTGKPKGVVLTQDTLFYSARNSVKMHAMTAADHILMVLPMFHAGGFNIHTLPALSVGASVRLHPLFEPGATLTEIDRGQVTLTGLVPAQIAAMVAHPAWAKTDVSHLRCVTTGSTHVPDSCIEAWRRRGVMALQVYGATETCAVAIHQSVSNAGNCYGSVGHPASHCEVRLIDDQGEPVAAGGHGEILIRGDCIFSGYWQQTERTGTALVDGWFCSGDIGYQRTDGSYVISGRKTDMIISGGENIYPAELESVLLAHSEITDAAVLAYPDEIWGEVAVAFVVRQPGSVMDTEAIMSLFTDSLARFKHPKQIIFLDRLPRNTVGKIEKNRLREQLASDEES